MAEIVHGPAGEVGACVCGWRSTASTPNRAAAGLRRHLGAAGRPIVVPSLPRSGSPSQRFVAFLFRALNGFGWMFLRGLVLGLVTVAVITTPARTAHPGWLFAVVAFVAVYAVSWVVNLAALVMLDELAPRIFGPPIYSGVLGPSRYLWRMAVATADKIRIEVRPALEPVLRGLARLHARTLFPRWARESYEQLPAGADPRAAALGERGWDDIWRNDVLGYQDPRSGETVAEVISDESRFQRAQLMLQRLDGLASLAPPLSMTALLILLAIAVPAATHDLSGVTALQASVATLFVVALLLRAYLWVAFSNLSFDLPPALVEQLSTGEQQLVGGLRGKRMHLTTRFLAGFDLLLHRTLTASLSLNLVAFSVVALGQIAAAAAVSWAWPGGPHEIPSAYGVLALAVLALPVGLLLGLNLVFAVVGNARGVVVPVVSGLAAAALAGFMTLTVSGDTSDVADALRGAWVGLPTALAASIVAAVQRPRPAE